MAQKQPTVVVKNCDMDASMMDEAIEISGDALLKFNTEKEVAQAVRETFRKKYHGVWHCFVGRNFGAYMTHEANHYAHFYFGQIAVLLFKTG